jgi:hypothetical protein
MHGAGSGLCSLSKRRGNRVRSSGETYGGRGPAGRSRSCEAGMSYEGARELSPKDDFGLGSPKSSW